MNDVSYAMKYAKSHIAMYEDHGDIAFDIQQHKQALDCWNCQAFIQLGIESYEWLIKADMMFRKCFYSGKIEYDANIEGMLEELFRRWLVPCKFANEWIDEQYKRGFVLENLKEFRKCEEEMIAIVGAFDEADDLPEAMHKLQEEALKEHANGKTSEFV